MKTLTPSVSARASAFLATLLLCVSHIVSAQNNELSVKLQLERATTVDGKIVMVATERAAPNEVLQYVASYENLTHTLGRVARPISGVVATLPIPNEMAYTGTATPSPATASLDGKVFTAYPVMKSVKQADGTSKFMPAAWSEYRALRWNLPEILPKAKVDVSAGIQLSALSITSSAK